MFYNLFFEFEMLSEYNPNFNKFLADPKQCFLKQKGNEHFAVFHVISIGFFKLFKAFLFIEYSSDIKEGK